MIMVNTKYISSEDMVDKIKSLKRRTNLKFYKNFSNYYDNMIIRMDEDTFAKNAQGFI